MTYNVLVEGQTIPVPEEIGTSDDAVKRALAPFYPEVANALITRVEKDGVTTINVVKRAGSKGAGLAALIACPGGENPAIALYRQYQQQDPLEVVDPLEIITLDARIESALEEGQVQAEAVARALKRLVRSTARRTQVVVRGF